MATITIQVVTVADGTLSKTLTIPEAHATRLIAAYQSRANTAVGGTATRTQVWLTIFNALVSTWTNEVKYSETTAATTTAVAGVTPVSIT